MTKLLFQDALLNCFASKMEKYYFKILCIANNPPEHSLFIGDLHPKIKSPAKYHSLMQSMGQGIIVAFKAYHLKRTFAQSFAAAEEDTDAILEGL